MEKSETGVYLVLGEVNLLLTAIRRNTRWTSHNYHSENENELISNMVKLKNILNEITELSSISSTEFLSPFLAIIRSEEITGPITGLALTSINKFLSYRLIEHGSEQSTATAVEQIADAVTHARFVGTDPSSDEVILLEILYVLRSLMLSASGVFLTNESVCEIIQSCFRICFEMRLSELLCKSAEHTLVDMVQLLFGRLSDFKDDPRQSPLRKLKMRTGSGLVECTKTPRLRKKSPKVKAKSRPQHVSKETINMQDSSSFNQQPSSSSLTSAISSKKSNNKRNTNNNNNNNDDEHDEHDLNASNDTINTNIDSANSVDADVTASTSKENFTTENVTDDNINNKNNNFINDNNNNDNDTNSDSINHRAVRVPDTLDLSPEYHHHHHPDQDHHQDHQDHYQEGITPASEGPEDAVDMGKENYVWVDNIGCPTSTYDTVTPSDPPIDHILTSNSEEAHRKEDKEEEREGGLDERGSEEEGKEEEEEFVNQRGVHFTPHVADGAGKHGASNQQQDENTSQARYSIPCICELFRFLISLTNPHDKHNSEVMIHMGLSLLTVSLEAGADHIRQCKSLLPLVKDDMCKHLFFLLKYERLSLFAAALRVCFLLFESMRGHLKLQMEMYVIKLMELVVSESPRVSQEQKEIALESVLQLLRVPGLISELYLNYDCSLYSSNLFEDLTKLLSKNAFPVSGLVSTNLLSLNALLAIVDTIAANCRHRAVTADNTQIDARSSDDNKRSDFGSMDNLPRIKGVLKHSSMPSSSSPVNLPPTGRWRMRHNRMKETKNTPTSEELALIKHNKKVYQTGTDQFNHKPSEGISYLQKHGLLSPQLDPEEVVAFIKQNPKLDKKQIGEFISARKNNNILEAYQKSFNFEGTRIDEALRMYLESFRLPGEAPVISYLLEHFAEHWHKTNREPFENADAAFTLAYAVIMLNVDQHNFNAKKQNVPMTCESFKKNLSKVNGGRDFEAEMLEEVYQCIKTDEIVMPAEQVGLVRDNYLWKVLLRRLQNKESEYQHVDTGTYDRDLFGIVWGPTVAALSFVFDRSTDNAIVQKAVNGFRDCAMISAYYEMSDVFDNLVISLCKFTTLLSVPESSDALAISFGNNQKAQLAARTVFALAHRHSDILHDGWRNILECIMQLFKANLLSEVLVRVEDFLDPSGRISLMREEQSSQNKADTGMLSNLYIIFYPPHPKNPPQEDVEATKRAQDCILECHVEQLIIESKFLREESLQELLKALISGSRCSDSLEDSGAGGGSVDESHVLRLELLFKVVLQNRDRISAYWSDIECHLYNTIVAPVECSFLVERAIVGLLRLACRLLMREELSQKVLGSLRILLRMKPGVLYNHLVCRHVSYGLHDLLKTNASNIHNNRDWRMIFTVICVAGISLITSPCVSAYLHNDPHSDLDSEAQSDSEVNRARRVDRDRGYTSDSEVYDGTKCATISSSSSFQALPASDNHSGMHSCTLSTGNSSPNAHSNTTLLFSNPPMHHTATNTSTTTDDASGLQEGRSRKKSSGKSLFVPCQSWFPIYQQSAGKELPRSKLTGTLDQSYNIALSDSLDKHDFKAFSKCCETLSFLVRDAAQMTPFNLPACIHSIRLFVEASVDGGVDGGGGGNHRVHTGQPRSGAANKGMHSKAGKSKSKKEALMRKSRSSPSHLVASKESRHSDDEDDDNADAYQTISIQLLDLMHTLHTRAATIFKSWSDERMKDEKDEAGGVVEAGAAAVTAAVEEEVVVGEVDGEGGRQTKVTQVSLWSSCWCPLLQGIARLCCDTRKQVRNQALTYLQRALLVHDLQVLSASEWEDCFSRVLFPLLSLLLQNLSPCDKAGAEETRMRASALLCKVFLQHLTPLLSLPTFTALWFTILDFMHKYMHADHSDLLLEAIPESLKNMLLVMQTAGILKEDAEACSELWSLTWDRINLFLPHLREEVFKPHEPTPPAAAAGENKKFQSTCKEVPDRAPLESPQQELQQAYQPQQPPQSTEGSPTTSQQQQQHSSTLPPQQHQQQQAPSSPPLHSPSLHEAEASKGNDFMSSIPLPTSHYILHTPLDNLADYQPREGLPLILDQQALHASGGGSLTPAAATANEAVVLEDTLEDVNQVDEESGAQSSL